MFKFLKKDSMWMGIALGIIVPGVLYLILHFTNQGVKNNVSGRSYLTDFMVQIIALAVNLIMLRYYLINLKADKTGRGILLVTFVIGVVLFILNLK